MNNLNYNTHVLPYIKDGLFQVDEQTRALQLKDDTGAILDDIFYIGAQNDANVQHIIFKLPRMFEHTDLSTANKVYIYMQVDNTTTRITINAARHYCDANNIYIDWIVGPEATANPGQALFSISLQNIDDTTTPNTINWKYGSQEAMGEIVSTSHSGVDLEPIELDIYENIDDWQGDYYFYSEDALAVDDSIEFDSNNAIFIYDRTRELHVDEELDLGVETDHHTKRIFIAFPKEYDGNDYSKDDEWKFYAHYTNADNQTDKSRLIKLTDINQTSAHYIFYTWLIPIGVTAKAGAVQLSFSIVKEEHGKIAKSFNSLSETLYVQKTVVGVDRFMMNVQETFEHRLIDALPDVLSEFNITINGNVW